MKLVISCTLILSFLLASCSTNEKKDHLFVLASGRNPASIESTTTCNNAFKYLVKKRQRSQAISSLIKDHKIHELKERFLREHIAERQNGKEPYSAFYRKLRRLNRSYEVPYLFSNTNKFVGDEDTFSTIIKIVDDNPVLDAEEAKAVDDALKWAQYVENYSDRLKQTIEKGAENQLIHDAIEKLTSGPKKLRARDFPTTIKVPIVNSNGDVVDSDLYFESLADMRDFMKKKEAQVNMSFTQNVMDETFKKSNLYTVMIDQALYVRRLELIVEQLNSYPVEKLNDDQKVLKKLINEVLSEPGNQPRKDVMKLVRRREARAEFWAAMKFWRSKNSLQNTKYTIPESFKANFSAFSPYAAFARSAAILSLVTGAVVTPITLLYEDNPHLDYLWSSIQNHINDFMVNSLGLRTASLSACIKSERAWTVEDGSTMNNFIESHLSRFTALQRVDPSYDPNQDQEYVNEKLRLQAVCAKGRLEWKSAQRIIETQQMLGDHGYRFAVHMIFIDLIAQEHPDKAELKELLYDYFEESELYEDLEKSQVSLTKISELMGESFTSELLTYQDGAMKMVPRVRNGTFPSYYENVEELYETIKELSEDE